MFNTRDLTCGGSMHQILNSLNSDLQNTSQATSSCLLILQRLNFVLLCAPCFIAILIDKVTEKYFVISPVVISRRSILNTATAAVLKMPPPPCRGRMPAPRLVFGSIANLHHKPLQPKCTNLASNGLQQPGHHSFLPLDDIPRERQILDTKRAVRMSVQQAHRHLAMPSLHTFSTQGEQPLLGLSRVLKSHHYQSPGPLMSKQRR